MLPCDFFYDQLKKQGISFFTGVPDSLLQSFCAFINDVDQNHIIAANEGGAVALAAGYHLATKEIPLVYMQNSGLGNAYNPLISLFHPSVYSIPVLLLVGWRGEPGESDEPQHLKSGSVTLQFFELLNIKTFILSASKDESQIQLKEAVEFAREKSCPVALLVKEGVFEKFKSTDNRTPAGLLPRMQAIKVCADFIDKLEERAFASTTGMISRELYSLRNSLEKKGKDFYNIGAMGHTSQIALGIALAKKNKQVFCFDGDGSVLMHLGSLAINGSLAAKNFCHIVFDNEAHDSVGGQSTASAQVDLCGIARACGYAFVMKASTQSEIETFFKSHFIPNKGPWFLQIKVARGYNENLGRPQEKPLALKELFQKNFK